MYQYPYGNAQQLNLDWILSKLQELESGSGGGADLEEVANALVSASFDATIPYRKYDYAFYDGKLYRALNDNIGAFNPADWLEVTLGADIPVLTRLVNAVDASLTTLQGQVADLDSDDVDNASNVTGTTVTDALETLGTTITNLQNNVNDLDSDDIDNASLVVSGATVTAALGNLNGAITSVQNTDSAIENGLAIVANGNTHAAIAYGQFVYIKGHGTLAEGFYVATAAIPLNGTLSASNVAAIPLGGLNALNNITSQIEFGTWQPEIYDLNTFVRNTNDRVLAFYFKVGKIVIVTISTRVNETQDFSGISTMLQFRNVPYSGTGQMITAGGIASIQNYTGNNILTVQAGIGDRIYIRPNVTSAQITNAASQFGLYAIFILNN